MSVMEAGTTQVLARLAQGQFQDLLTLCEELEIAIHEECAALTTWASAPVPPPGAPAGAEMDAPAPPPPEPSPPPADGGLSAEQANLIGLLYATHMLVYVLEGQLCAGRFLWKRTPPAIQQVPQASQAHEVLSALWRRS
eukprot:TRINITY_DN56750_c0_g1_i1.p1 TRINITY_DN56750_c0_g1~~TRINITY_DN56750_c0_g1_i1.p1  ORF type:complete len:139 (+),score=28.10 TRINITY_DN56750_c0_g1_i1:160-576(+)